MTTTGADNKASQSGCVFVVTLSWSLEIRSVVWDLISGINHHLWSSCLLDQNSVIDKNLHAPNLSRSRSLILKQKNWVAQHSWKTNGRISWNLSTCEQDFKNEKQIRRGQQGKQIKEDRLKCSFLVDYCTPTSRKTRLKFLSVGKKKKAINK